MRFYSIVKILYIIAVPFKLNILATRGQCFTIFSKAQFGEEKNEAAFPMKLETQHS